MRDQAIGRGQPWQGVEASSGPIATAERLEGRQLLAAHPAVDTVLEWNGILCDAILVDRTQPGPTRSSRNMAIVQAAVFDAVNGIDHTYQQYLNLPDASKSFSKDAAAASAAFETLSRLYPQQKATFQGRLKQSLGRIKDGLAESGGVAYGKFVAGKVLDARKNDGYTTVVPYTPSTEPGKWRPDPLNPTQMALGPEVGAITPFGLKTADQFEPPPAPDLTSQQYTDAFNEVKSLGEKTSKTRTAEQTQIAKFWAYDVGGVGPPPVLYNEVLRTIAQQTHNNLVKNARLFALADVAQADAGIAAWNCKYLDNFWRPITAIREADTDGNPNTVADPDWVPLGTPGDGRVPDFTPPFPAYVSGHATFGGAIFTTLARFYGTDKFNFTLTSDELPGVKRSFTSFSQASAENARSRIYLGIHWNFDDVQGRALGNKVADYVFTHDFGRRVKPHG